MSRIRPLTAASVFIIGVLVCTVAEARTISIATKDGQEREVSYTNRTLHRSGIRFDSGGVLEFAEITAIRTDDFDAYEKAVNLTGKARAGHVTVAFTGDEEVNVLRLQRLEKQRRGAGVGRGAGGFMMLFGALSGNRDVHTTGLVTYGAGAIAKDLDNDTGIAAQSQAIAELQKQQKKQSGDLSLEEQFRLEWGNEVVNGLIVLVGGNHARALSLANANKTSSDANRRLAAMWLKAIVEADRGNLEAAEKEYERLVNLDPELESVDEGHEWMELLLGNLNALRAA